MIDNNGGWSLGFMHEQWRLTTGAAFPLTLTFDGQQPFNVHGIPIADKLVRVPMPSNSSLIAQFRKAKAMTAYTQGQLFQFNPTRPGSYCRWRIACCQATVASADFRCSPPPRKLRRHRTRPGQARQTVRPEGHRLPRVRMTPVTTHVVHGCVGDILGNPSSESARCCA
jgi:hypothetical protein